MIDKLKKNKKLIIIILIVLILIGLIVFGIVKHSSKSPEGAGNDPDVVQPNPDENNNNTENDDKINTGTNNGSNSSQTVSSTVNDSYKKALEAVIEAEDKVDIDSYNAALKLIKKVTGSRKANLQRRLDEVKNGIDAIALVQELEAQTKAASNKEALESARSFRKDQIIVDRVSNLTNEKLKSSLQETLKNLAGLLDDTESPKVNIDDEALLNKKTTILVEDDNEVILELTEKNSGKTVQIYNGYEVEDGVYTLRVIDAAFNETIITFTIDTIAPEIANIEDGAHYKEITPEISANEVYALELKYEDEVIEYTIGDAITTDGEYVLTVTDLAGNSTVVNFIIDNVAPEITPEYLTKTFELDKTASFKNPKITVSDNYTAKEDIIVEMVCDATLAEVGEYTCTVSATDKAGNVTSETLTIIVEDSLAPTITGIEANTTYFDKISISISDNSDSYTIYYGSQTTCEELIAEGTKYELTAEEIEELKTGKEIEITDGQTFSICVVDSSDNQTLISNVTVKKYEEDSDIIDAINNAKTGEIIILPVLPEEIEIAASSLTIGKGVTIYGNETITINGELHLDYDGIELYDVNVVLEASQGAALVIAEDVQNIVIDGGTYKIVDKNLQGQGAIRALGNNTLTIKNTTLYGGIHLFDFSGSIDGIKGNTIILEYEGETPLTGIMIKTDNEISAEEIYTNNTFVMENQPNSYYVLIHPADIDDWTVVDSVKVVNE